MGKRPQIGDVQNHYCTVITDERADSICATMIRDASRRLWNNRRQASAFFRSLNELQPIELLGPKSRRAFESMFAPEVRGMYFANAALATFDDFSMLKLAQMLYRNSLPSVAGECVREMSEAIEMSVMDRLERRN